MGRYLTGMCAAMVVSSSRGGRFDLDAALDVAGAADLAGVEGDLLFGHGAAHDGAQQGVGVGAQGRCLAVELGVPLMDGGTGDGLQGHRLEGGHDEVVGQLAVVLAGAWLEVAAGEPALRIFAEEQVAAHDLVEGGGDPLTRGDEFVFSDEPGFGGGPDGEGLGGVVADGVGADVAGVVAPAGELAHVSEAAVSALACHGPVRPPSIAISCDPVRSTCDPRSTCKCISGQFRPALLDRIYAGQRPVMTGQPQFR